MALALVGGATSAARADEPAPVTTEADTAAAAAAATPPPPGDALTLPKGRVLIDAFLEIGLSSGDAFKPISLSPDLWYGVSDKFTVGLVHSGTGETGFMGAAGNSLCFSGSSVCKVYNDVALDTRYTLKQGSFSWAFDGGLGFLSLSPSELNLKLGAVGRWQSDKIAVELEPELFFGLTNRTGMVGGNTVHTNPDDLAVPVTLLYSVSPKLDVDGQTGLILPFEDTGSTYAIPLSVGLHYRVSVPLNIFAAFSFPDLIGGGGAGGSIRSLTLGGSYAI
jgi:hypothetical protein